MINIISCSHRDETTNIMSTAIIVIIYKEMQLLFIGGGVVEVFH